MHFQRAPNTGKAVHEWMTTLDHVADENQMFTNNVKISSVLKYYEPV